MMRRHHIEEPRNTPGGFPQETHDLPMKFE